MDTNRKNALYGVSAFLICILLWYVVFFDSRVYALNQLLENDAELASYPYQFKVLNIDDGVATMSSPRSAQHSALVSLRIMFPNLVYENDDSPRMLEAQKTLASIQYKAKSIVEQEAEINAVKWELDERWLNGNGVSVY